MEVMGLVDSHDKLRARATPQLPHNFSAFSPDILTIALHLSQSALSTPSTTYQHVSLKSFFMRAPNGYRIAETPFINHEPVVLFTRVSTS